ncbi:TetR/AcrR family transcriptional regulator [Nitrosophilus kaiyonis]|uniref:TetR/AcrR family transcriptional regulator n=1 Tax=Nitrosophilus kaiyonis TaxID=2930200 RepID=UPI0024917950|nr:TetR/AcrR family transcriptional regulator [Nitrosophilus kaiyonis]
MNSGKQDVKNKKTTKEKILDAALELISVYGYKGASVRKIAKVVGIRESAIYNHFKNKEEIFKEIMKTLFTTPFDEYFEKKPIETNALRGKRFLSEYAATIKLITFDVKNEKFFKIILIELMQNKNVRDMFLKYFYEDNIKNLSKAFFIMMQEGMIRTSDPMLMAQEFFAPLFYYRLQVTLLRLDGKHTTMLSTIFEKHVDFFWESISIG